ncbi:MAG: S8 family serine peptidase, partial [bacterium]|nr:S8 family serine peptidase [bacterium]
MKSPRGIKTLIVALALLGLMPWPANGQQPKAEGSDSQIALDKDFYSPNDEIVVTVTDRDENADPKKQESIVVTVSVWRHADSEKLTLLETGPNTAEFSNPKGLPISDAKSQVNDGRIEAGKGQVIEVRYVDADDPADRSDDQSIVKGGVFSYTIDPELTPGQSHVAGEPSRPVALVVNPGGFRDEFVANEVIVSADDPAVVDDVVATYNGKVMHDGELLELHPLTPPGEIRQVGENTGYVLVRVDLAKADMTDFERRMTALGLHGEFIFSSKEALQLSAILLRQKELQRNVTPNMMAKLARCPCHTSPEDPPLDAFDPEDFPWLDSSWWRRGSDGFDALGVTLSWQLLDGLGISPPDDPHDPWDPVRLAIIDAGFAPNDDWPFSDIDDYECVHSYFTPVTETMATGIYCGGYLEEWHGTGVFGVVASLLSNAYGSAGTAGICRGDPERRLTILLSNDHEMTYHSVGLNVQSRVRAGADVINLSLGGECDWWCLTFGYLSGKDMLSDGLQLAERAGAIVVAAAGNDGMDLGHRYWWGNRRYFPCEGPGVVCVGATIFEHDLFRAADWSNYGGGVDIWAPTNIRVHTPNPTDHSYPPGTHASRVFSGTSAATPYVAGVFTMIKALYPDADRASFDSAAAHGSLGSTAWIGMATGPTDVLLLDGDRLRSDGLINPWGMVLDQAGDLGFSPGDVDEREGDDATGGTVVTLEDDEAVTISGVIVTAADQDFFQFEVDEYWDLTARLTDGTDLDHLRIRLVDADRTIAISSMTPSGEQVLSAAIEPRNNYYRLVVEDAGSSEFFNCYELEISVDPTDIDADDFDDGDPSTPAPWGSPGPRNDDLYHRTPLELPDDPLLRSTNLSFSGAHQLNFDVVEDADFFQVQLPVDPGAFCGCVCGSGTCSKKVILTVTADDPVDVTV